MPELNDTVLQRIDVVLGQLTATPTNHIVGHQCIAETLTIVEAIYGSNSIQLQRLKSSLDRAHPPTMRFGHALNEIRYVLCGTLQAVRSDLAGGRLTALIRTAVANLVLDFVSLAERASEDGRSDVAAVLASAAFEDLMKKHAEDFGLDIAGKDLSEVINALKGAGNLGGAQAKVASSYVALRNKAMHAEWDKINATDVAGLIAFVKIAASSGATVTA